MALAAVNSIIARTATGRQTVVATIEAVEACTMTPSDAQVALTQVVVQRQQARSDLITLERRATTGQGYRTAIRGLTTVIDDSIQADENYAAWIGDIAASTPSCRAGPFNDPNLSAGEALSARTETDKRIFLQAWNPLAGAAGLATYRPQDF